MGNEYAKAQYGVTIDTDLTAENASYFPGTADSVAWLAANGGQEALNRAVRGNVDATFQNLQPWMARMPSEPMHGLTAPCAIAQHRTSTSWWCCTDKIEYPTEGRQRKLPAFCVGRKDIMKKTIPKLLTLVCLLAALMGLSAVTAHAETISGTISGGRNYRYYEDKSNVPQWGSIHQHEAEILYKE